MNQAERFQAWKKKRYPTASRVHTSMMYAAWSAALGPVAAPKKVAPKKPPLKASSKALKTGQAGDE